MKKLLFFVSAILFSINAWSQVNMVTLSGGYSFANLEDTDVGLSGWRINGLYEAGTFSGKVLQGLSVGYISVSGSATVEEDGIMKNAEYKLGTVPIYYAPKLLLGNSDKFKGFVKLAIGGQFSSINRTGTAVILEADDFGFYGGGGAGFMYFLKSNIFLNMEYEWAWLSNTYYRDGGMNTASAGIGMKF